MSVIIRGDSVGRQVEIDGVRFDVEDPDVEFPIAGVTDEKATTFVVISIDGRVRVDIGLTCIVMTWDTTDAPARWHAELSESGTERAGDAPLYAAVSFFAYNPIVAIDAPAGASVEVDAQ